MALEAFKYYQRQQRRDLFVRYVPEWGIGGYTDWEWTGAVVEGPDGTELFELRVKEQLDYE